MKSAAEFSRLGQAMVVVEFVAGQQDGTRELLVRGPSGKPADMLLRGVETYTRRPVAERCKVDGLLVWHCDVDRP